MYAKLQNEYIIITFKKLRIQKFLEELDYHKKVHACRNRTLYSKKKLINTKGCNYIMGQNICQITEHFCGKYNHNE